MTHWVMIGSNWPTPYPTARDDTRTGGSNRTSSNASTVKSPADLMMSSDTGARRRTR